MEQPTQTGAACLSPDQRRVFDRLRDEFFAGTQLRGRCLECKLLKLASSFETPPAKDWAGLTVGGCVERFATLSRLNDQQEIVQIRGPATNWYCALAEQAGNALPAGIPDGPILFDDIRRNKFGVPVGLRGPRPVVNRDALGRWLGFVFATLKQQEHEALHVHWGTPMGPMSYGFATLDVDLCAASVLAMDLAGLTATLAPVPTDTGVGQREDPRVKLRGRDEGPIVLGTTKRKLTTPQYNVVKALLDAGHAGLTKDELVEKSGHEDARGILTRLSASDDDWKEVIHFAVQTGGGYRIR
jgi:hypothetical protein